MGANGYDAAYSFGAYEAELRELIHLFKYAKIRTLAGPLGKFLAVALPREQAYDVIVPMPLHIWRRWQRGFNQSELLAREIGRRIHTPVKNLVRRVRYTRPQAGLTNAKRRTNVVRAFRAKNSRALEGSRVLLVDDVLTTGATARACAKALKKAGAGHVTVLTLARVDRRLAAASYDLNERFPELIFSGSFEDAKSGSFA